MECQQLSGFLIRKKKGGGRYRNQPSHAVISSVTRCKGETLSELVCICQKLWERQYICNQITSKRKRLGYEF